MTKRTDQHTMIRAAVASIPRGRVATYGQVARMAGLAGRARLVGTILGRLDAASPIPWHRVVGAGGRISQRPGSGALEQRVMLEQEGVVFGSRDRIDLGRFGWEGDAL